MKNVKIAAAFIVLFCAGFICNAAPLSADKRQQLDISQNSQKIRAKGNLPLYFADAETGNPVKGVSVIMLHDGTAYETGKNGFVSIPQLEDGDYSIRTYANGYVSEEFEFSVKAGFIPNYRFVLCKKMLPQRLRIVLQWGERPADLDLHLEKEGGYHISYRNMITADDESANLDRDDTSSFGPETITINSLEKNVNYYIYVVDYTNRNNATAQGLGGSGAVIKIYDGEELINVFYVPEGKSGNRWNVCSVLNGEIFENQTVVTNY